MRWEPKNDLERAQNQCLKARWLGSGYWGDPWKGSDEELFEEKKRMYRKASKIDSESTCGWRGIYWLYRRRGMMKEAHEILDEWEAMAPPDKHKIIDNIRHDLIEL